MSVSKPDRRHRLTLNIEADTWPGLLRLLGYVADKVTSQLSPDTVLSETVDIDGAHLAVWLKLDPEMNGERYREALARAKEVTGEIPAT